MSNHYHKTIESQIKRFIHSASSEYSLAPCWLVLSSGRKPSFVKSIAIPDSLYCLSYGLKESYVLELKHTDIIENLTKNCEISNNFASIIWSFASKQAPYNSSIFPSLVISPTLHDRYFQLNMVMNDRCTK